jgi:nucleotide-binding universal stress UspA family protein
MGYDMMPEDNGPIRLLVAVDFSDCCEHALETAIELFKSRPIRLFLLHVVDERFVGECIRHCISNEADIKKRLFKDAKKRLHAMVNKKQLSVFSLHKIVCQGIPYKEISRQAEKNDVDIVIMGSCGMTGNLEAIFFGGTAERLMRFISRPVFCIPPNIGSRKMMNS